MARPIEITPVITGEDAERFQQSLLASLAAPSVSSDDRERQKQEFNEMKKFYFDMVAASNGVFR